jgi:Leucine-rich repeat (LRR) protein
MKEISRELIINNSDSKELNQINYLRIFDEKIIEIKNLELIPQVKIINFSHNHISEIKNLNKCLELRELNISNNQITSVNTIVFDSNKFLMHLNLGFNNIENITASIILQRL